MPGTPNYMATPWTKFKPLRKTELQAAGPLPYHERPSSVPDAMNYLIVVTILWAFSFSLIGQYLAGQVDSDLAVLVRVLIATAQPEKKLVDEYTSLLILHKIDATSKEIDIRPAI